MLMQRYPIKTMLLAVVGRPLPHRNFNGKIYMERVSKEKFVATKTAQSNFLFDAVINSEIKNGAWKDLISINNTEISTLRDIVTNAYNLDGYVSD